MIRRQIVMPVSPERLWEALTDPDKMAGWFGARVDWALEEGGAARFFDNDGSVRAGRVKAVRPGRHLRFQWWPAGDDGAAMDDTDPPVGDGPEDASEVSYLLEPVGDGTRLTIQERQIGTRRDPGTAQASTAGGCGRWTPWDSRLAGAWAGLVAAPVLEAVRA